MQRKKRKTSPSFRIGIDLMGSDTPAKALLQATVDYYKQAKHPPEFVLLGTEKMFTNISLPPGVTTVTAPQIISMEDDPLVAIRRKKNSSMVAGIRLLKENKIAALISAGNTGALLASAKLHLPMLPGIERPALMTLLPTKKNEVAVLDVGANVAFTAEHLLQFASMGIAYQKSRGIAAPKVGLLNIGAEKKKGTPQLREAYEELLRFNQPGQAKVFSGNIEGRDVFQGDIDVLITDGFTGNIFLKTAEGIATFILEILEESAGEECSPHLKSILNTLGHRLHYAEYAGAILTGIDSILVKCHGNAAPEVFVNGIKGAIRLVEHNFLHNIKTQLVS